MGVHPVQVANLSQGLQHYIKCLTYFVMFLANKLTLAYDSPHQLSEALEMMSVKKKLFVVYPMILFVCMCSYKQCISSNWP